MKKVKYPFVYRLIRGAIGKRFVVKHYGKKMVVTKYPDMTNIIPSAGQRKQRNLFAEAVAYAKTVIADPVLKAAWQERIRRKNGVWNEAIKHYLEKAKAKKQRSMRYAAKVIKNSFQGDFTQQPQEEVHARAEGFHDKRQMVRQRRREFENST